MLRLWEVPLHQFEVANADIIDNSPKNEFGSSFILSSGGVIQWKIWGTLLQLRYCAPNQQSAQTYEMNSADFASVVPDIVISEPSQSNTLAIVLVTSNGTLHRLVFSVLTTLALLEQSTRSIHLSRDYKCVRACFISQSQLAVITSSTFPALEKCYPTSPKQSEESDVSGPTNTQLLVITMDDIIFQVDEYGAPSLASRLFSTPSSTAILSAFPVGSRAIVSIGTDGQFRVYSIKRRTLITTFSPFPAKTALTYAVSRSSLVRSNPDEPDYIQPIDQSTRVVVGVRSPQGHAITALHITEPANEREEYKWQPVMEVVSMPGLIWDLFLCKEMLWAIWLERTTTRVGYCSMQNPQAWNRLSNAPPPPFLQTEDLVHLFYETARSYQLSLTEWFSSVLNGHSDFLHHLPYVNQLLVKQSLEALQAKERISFRNHPRKLPLVAEVGKTIDRVVERELMNSKFYSEVEHRRVLTSKWVAFLVEIQRASTTTRPLAVGLGPFSQSSSVAIAITQDQIKTYRALDASEDAKKDVFWQSVSEVTKTLEIWQGDSLTSLSVRWQSFAGDNNAAFAKELLDVVRKTIEHKKEFSRDVIDGLEESVLLALSQVDLHQVVSDVITSLAPEGEIKDQGKKNGVILTALTASFGQIVRSRLKTLLEVFVWIAYASTFHEQVLSIRDQGCEDIALHLRTYRVLDWLGSVSCTTNRGDLSASLQELSVASARPLQVVLTQVSSTAVPLVRLLLDRHKVGTGDLLQETCAHIKILSAPLITELRGDGQDANGKDGLFAMLVLLFKLRFYRQMHQLVTLCGSLMKPKYQNLLGLAALKLKSYEAASTHFLRAVQHKGGGGQMYWPEAPTFDSGSSTHYKVIMDAFMAENQPQHALVMAHALSRDIASGNMAASNEESYNVQLLLFDYSLVGCLFDNAFSALQSLMKQYQKERQRFKETGEEGFSAAKEILQQHKLDYHIRLERFLRALSRSSESHRLSEYTWGNMEEQVEAILWSQARASDVESPAQIDHAEVAYMTLYSFLVENDRHRAAAKYMYDYANRLERKTDLNFPRALERYADALSCVLTALNLVTEDPWIIHEDVVFETDTSAAPSLDQVREPNSEADDEDRDNGDEEKDGDNDDRDTFEESNKRRKTRLVGRGEVMKAVDVVHVRRKHARARAHMAVAVADQGRITRGGLAETCSTYFSLDGTGKTTLNIMVHFGLFESAMSFGTLLGLDLVPVIQALTNACVQLQYNNSEALPEEVDHMINLEEARAVLVSSPFPPTKSPTGAELAWSLLRTYLDLLQKSGKPAIHYPEVVAETILQSETRILVPGWLIAIFRQQNSTRSKTGIFSLLRLMTKYELFQEAAELAASATRECERVVLEAAEAGDEAAWQYWYPWALIQDLLVTLQSLAGAQGTPDHETWMTVHQDLSSAMESLANVLGDVSPPPEANRR